MLSNQVFILDFFDAAKSSGQAFNPLIPSKLFIHF